MLLNSSSHYRAGGEHITVEFLVDGFAQLGFIIASLLWVKKVGRVVSRVMRWLMVDWHF